MTGVSNQSVIGSSISQKTNSFSCQDSADCHSDSRVKEKACEAFKNVPLGSRANRRKQGRPPKVYRLDRTNKEANEEKSTSMTASFQQFVPKTQQEKVALQPTSPSPPAQAISEQQIEEENIRYATQMIYGDACLIS